DAARLRLQARHQRRRDRLQAPRRRAPEARARPRPRDRAFPPGHRAGRAMTAPVLALSIGCPSGVGPEVAVLGAAATSEAPCVLVGDEAVIRRAAALRDVAAERLVLVGGASGAEALAEGSIGIFAGSTRLASPPPYGKPDAAAGAAQLAWIDEATDLVRSG